MTPEQFDRLPKYAKARIKALQSQRDQAVKALNDFEDTVTPSKVWYEDYVFDGGREGERHDTRKVYVQSERVRFTHQGVTLEVSVYENEGIKLSWGCGKRPHGLGDICFVPTAYQQARLTNVVYDTHELNRLLRERDYDVQQTNKQQQ